MKIKQILFNIVIGFPPIPLLGYMWWCIFNLDKIEGSPVLQGLLVMLPFLGAAYAGVILGTNYANRFIRGRG